MRSKDIILPNHDLTVFNISEVSESYVIKNLSQLRVLGPNIFLIVILY